MTEAKGLGPSLLSSDFFAFYPNFNLHPTYPPPKSPISTLKQSTGMKNISIIGSGTMGNGIAHVMAQYGHRVSLIDINPDALERALQTIQRNMERQIAKGLLTEAQQKAAMERIQPFSDLSEGVKTAEDRKSTRLNSSHVKMSYAVVCLKKKI